MCKAFVSAGSCVWEREKPQCCSDSCNGAVSSLLQGDINVSWNASKRCYFFSPNLDWDGDDFLFSTRNLILIFTRAGNSLICLNECCYGDMAGMQGGNGAAQDQLFQQLSELGTAACQWGELPALSAREAVMKDLPLFSKLLMCEKIVI